MKSRLVFFSIATPLLAVTVFVIPAITAPPTSLFYASEVFAASPAQDSVGYLGCSNTEDTVGGYYLVSNENLFWRPYDTAGGTLDMWANPQSQFWANFDQELQKYGQPLKVWIQICEDAQRKLTFKDVQETINLLRQRVPRAKYYISPLNSFSPTDLCQITGPDGVQDATNLADQAISGGLALQGPILGPLTSSQTLPPGMCHPNTAGERLLGYQLSRFFDILA